MNVLKQPLFALPDLEEVLAVAVELSKFVAIYLQDDYYVVIGASAGLS